MIFLLGVAFYNLLQKNKTPNYWFGAKQGTQFILLAF